MSEASIAYDISESYEKGDQMLEWQEERHCRNGGIGRASGLKDKLQGDRKCNHSKFDKRGECARRFVLIRTH